MDPKHLYYLSVVLEKGSITEASKHLAVTQPTLTRLMSVLEMQAGTTLFSRSRYGVKATPIGEALAREGRSIKNNIEAASHIASRYRIGLDKEIRIGVGPLLSATIIPDVTLALLEKLPRLSLTIKVTSPTKIIDSLLDDDLDLAIAPAASSRVIPGCSRTRVADDVLGIFCSVDNVLAKKKEVTIEDLASSNWITLGHGSPFEREVMELLASAGVSKIKTQVVLSNDGTLLLEILQKGSHLSVLPKMPIRESRFSERLVELKFSQNLTQSRDIFLWAREESKDLPVHSILKEILCERYLS